MGIGLPAAGLKKSDWQEVRMNVNDVVDGGLSLHNWFEPAVP